MTTARQQYTEARRVARTFMTFCGLACAQAEAGDLDLLSSANRWVKAVYQPLNRDGKLVDIWIATMRTGTGLGPSIPVLRQDRETLRTWLSHYRLRRVFHSARREARYIP